MQLFSADATKSWKNHPQKLLRKTQIHFFFLTASSAQTTQTEEFMFQNVAYRPTVYRTGALLGTCSFSCRGAQLVKTFDDYGVYVFLVNLFTGCYHKSFVIVLESEKQVCVSSYLGFAHKLRLQEEVVR